MKIARYQQWAIFILLLLLAALYFYTLAEPTIFKGSLWGVSTFYWFVFAFLAPILHQFYVLVCWRSELYFQSISKNFGEQGFKVYKILFAILILSRLITIVLLAVSSAQTLSMNPLLSYVLSVLLFIPAIYLAYSVARYFGIDRAFGIDHFRPLEVKKQPFVKKGIFKYTSNGMYIYGLLILWIPGLLLQSEAALLLAIFNHIYVWVHYYFTELPDIKIIYKN